MTNCIFEPRTDTSSATICKYCGQEKYLHINCTAPLISDMRKMEEDDVEKLALNEYPIIIKTKKSIGGNEYDTDVNYMERRAFVNAYNKAKETLYTEEEAIDFHKWAFQKVRIEESDKTTKELFAEWQSLKQPKKD
jgi:hypothetical protein